MFDEIKLVNTTLETLEEDVNDAILAIIESASDDYNNTIEDLKIVPTIDGVIAVIMWNHE